MLKHVLQFHRITRGSEPHQDTYPHLMNHFTRQRQNIIIIILYVSINSTCASTWSAGCSTLTVQEIINMFYVAEKHVLAATLICVTGDCICCSFLGNIDQDHFGRALVG